MDDAPFCPQARIFLMGTVYSLFIHASTGETAQNTRKNRPFFA
jgi:hypothetical protein